MKKNKLTEEQIKERLFEAEFERMHENDPYIDFEKTVGTTDRIERITFDRENQDLYCSVRAVDNNGVEYGSAESQKHTYPDKVGLEQMLSEVKTLLPEVPFGIERVT